MDLQIIKCPGCNNLYDDNLHLPKILSCGHSVCFSCLDKLDQKNVILCCDEKPVKFDGNYNLNTNTLILEYIRKHWQQLSPQSQTIQLSKSQTKIQSQSLQQINKSISQSTRNLQRQRSSYFNHIEKRIQNIESMITNKVQPDQSNENLLENSRLENQILTLKAKLNNKNQTITKQKQEIFEIKKENKQKYRKQEQEKGNKIFLATEREKQNQVFHNKKWEVLDLQTRLSQTEEKIRQQETKIQSQNQELQKVSSDLLIDRQKLNQSKSQNKLLQDYIQELEQKTNGLENQNQNLIQQYKTCNTELDLIKKTKGQNNLTKKWQSNLEAKEKSSNLQILRQQIQQKDEQILTLEQNQQKLNNNNEYLQKQLDQLKAQFRKIIENQSSSRLTLESESVQSENQTIKNENKKLKTYIQQLETEKDQLKSLKRFYEENKEKQEIFINQLEKELQIKSSFKQSNAYQQLNQELINLKSLFNEFQQKCQCKAIEQQLLELFQIVNEQYKNIGKKILQKEEKEFQGYSLFNKFQIIILQIKSILMEEEQNTFITISTPQSISQQKISSGHSPKNSSLLRTSPIASRDYIFKQNIFDTSLKDYKNLKDQVFLHMRKSPSTQNFHISASSLENDRAKEILQHRRKTAQRLIKLKKQ